MGAMYVALEGVAGKSGDHNISAAKLRVSLILLNGLYGEFGRGRRRS